MAVWLKRKESLGPTHPQTLAAKALLRSAIQELDTTDGGIKNLKAQIELEPNNQVLKDRLARGENTNRLRTIAGEELDIQRPQALGTLYSAAIPYYDYAEAKSIIDSTVEANIKYATNKNEVDDTPVSDGEYQQYITNLEQRVLETTGEIDERTQKTVELLREQNPPTRTTMNAYGNIDHTLLTGKNQLEKEIIRTATIQNVHPRTLAAFYEGYRNQYNELYKNLPAEERPDPPQHWVEGDLSGYKKASNTTFAPSDPASLYAIYRLRSDENAIPENFKSDQKNLVSINLITADKQNSKAAQEGNTPILGISMTEYSPDGEELNKSNTWVKPPTNMPKEIRDKIVHEQGIDPDKLANKPRMADIKHVIQNHLTGKTLVVSGEKATINTLQKTLGETFKPRSVIDINDTASKQFSQHDSQLATTIDTLGLSQFSDTTKKNTESLIIGEAYFTQRKKIKSSWERKEQRKTAPVLKTIPPAGRWAKK